jgi:hypothetical protein
MAESSNANTTVSGLKVTLNRSSLPEQGRDAESADFTKIGFQEQNIF